MSRPLAVVAVAVGGNALIRDDHAAEGYFGPGSMGPKVEALLDFVRGRPSGRGAITNAENTERALRGQTGTWIEG
jgi:carbamate kinase